MSTLAGQRVGASVRSRAQGADTFFLCGCCCRGLNGYNITVPLARPNEGRLFMKRTQPYTSPSQIRSKKGLIKGLPELVSALSCIGLYEAIHKGLLFSFHDGFPECRTRKHLDVGRSGCQRRFVVGTPADAFLIYTWAAVKMKDGRTILRMDMGLGVINT